MTTGFNKLRLEFFGLPAHGHINPTLPVITELVRRGHTVRYWAYGEFREKIERTGAQFADLSHYLKVDYTRPDENLFRLALVLLKGSDRVLEGVLPQLKDNPPDLILYDSLACWGKHLSQVLKIPSVCSVTTFAMNQQVIGSSRSQTGTLINMAVKGLPALLEFSRLSTQLARQYDIPKPTLKDIFNNAADLNIVYTSSEFQPFAESFPSSYRFVGPSLELPDAKQPLTFSPPQNKPLIYISLGTLNNENLKFYRTCFAALKNKPLHVVLSVGKKISIADLGEIPKNFTVLPSVPQVQVLQRAQLFVTHGGMNSVHEALVTGTPMVVVPQASDQRWVAERVQGVGAGVLLEKKLVTPERLSQAIDQVFANPSYAKVSQHIGEDLLKQGGWKRAASEIEAFYEQVSDGLEPMQRLCGIENGFKEKSK
jgi:MGT family glycosyltransferase